MDLLLCAYIFTKGQDPDFILKKTEREKNFYLAALLWEAEKNKIEVK